MYTWEWGGGGRGGGGRARGVPPVFMLSSPLHSRKTIHFSKMISLTWYFWRHSINCFFNSSFYYCFSFFKNRCFQWFSTTTITESFPSASLNQYFFQPWTTFCSFYLCSQNSFPDLIFTHFHKMTFKQWHSRQDINVPTIFQPKSNDTQLIVFVTGYFTCIDYK